MKVAKYLLAILASLSSFGLFATPLVDSHALNINTGMSQYGDVTVYRDHQDAKTFWWFPYKFAISKSPGLNTPRVYWTAYSEQPIITVVSSMESFPFQVHLFVKKEIAESEGLMLSDIHLKPLKIVTGSLQLDFSDMSQGVFYGEFKQRFSLIGSNITDQIILDEESNANLLRLYKFDHAGFSVKAAMDIQFEGMLSPAYFNRQIDTACVVKSLTGRSISSGLGKPLNIARLRRTISKNERSCVTEAFSRGDVSAKDIEDGWVEHLKDTRLIIQKGITYEITNEHDLLENYAAQGLDVLEKDIAEAKRLYPISLQSFIENLSPISQ